MVLVAVQRRRCRKPREACNLAGCQGHTILSYMLLSKGTVASVHSLSTTCTWKGRIRLAAIRGAVLLRQGREGSFCSSQGVAGQGSTTAAGMHGRSSSAGGLSQPANKLTGQFTPHALNTRVYRCAPVADQAVSNKRVLFDEGAHLRAVSIAKCRVPCFGGRAVGQGQASSSRAEDHDGACPLLPQLECAAQHKAARMPALPHLILIGSPPDQHSAAQQAQQACHAARFCCSNQGVAGSAGRHCAVLVSTTHCTGLLLSRAPGGTAARELHKLAGFKISTFKLTPNWFQDPACLSIGLPTAPHSSSLPASACVAEYSWQASPFNGTYASQEELSALHLRHRIGLFRRGLANTTPGSCQPGRPVLTAWRHRCK